MTRQEAPRTWRCRLLPLGLVVMALAAACAGGPPKPVPIDTAHDACAWCRMIVSDARFAGEVLVPNEEPRIFDDLGCLEGYLKNGPPLSADSAIYVVDHRTRALVLGRDAVYTRVDSLSGPMGSHVIAHATAASRDSDPDAARGVPVPFEAVFPDANKGQADRDR